MKKQACVAFQTLIIRSTMEVELTDGHREHLDDCLECEDAYLNAAPRWFANAQISEEALGTPALRALENCVAHGDALGAIRLMGLPDKFLPVVVECALKRKAIN